MAILRRTPGNLIFQSNQATSALPTGLLQFFALDKRGYTGWPEDALGVLPVTEDQLGLPVCAVTNDSDSYYANARNSPKEFSQKSSRAFP